MKIRRLALPVVAVSSFLAGTLAPVAFTQSETPPEYVAVAYMKVSPGGEQAYIEMERDVWKPIHKKLIEKGLQRSWSLYSLLTAGTGDAYNFVTIQTFDSLDQHFGADYDTVAVEANPSRTLDSIYEQMNETRDLVSYQLLQRLDHVE